MLLVRHHSLPALCPRSSTLTLIEQLQKKACPQWYLRITNTRTSFGAPILPQLISSREQQTNIRSLAKQHETRKKQIQLSLNSASATNPLEILPAINSSSMLIDRTFTLFLTHSRENASGKKTATGQMACHRGRVGSHVMHHCH